MAGTKSENIVTPKMLDAPLDETLVAIHNVHQAKAKAIAATKEAKDVAAREAFEKREKAEFERLKAKFNGLP